GVRRRHYLHAAGPESAGVYAVLRRRRVGRREHPALPRHLRHTAVPPGYQAGSLGLGPSGRRGHFDVVSRLLQWPAAPASGPAWRNSVHGRPACWICAEPERGGGSMKLRRIVPLDIENKILIPFACISLATVLCFCAILYFTEFQVKVEA